MPDLIDERFWMVWKEGGAGPTRVHSFEGIARAEAARLALINPGSVFYVLEAKSKVERREVVWCDLLRETTPPERTT